MKLLVVKVFSVVLLIMVLSLSLTRIHKSDDSYTVIDEIKTNRTESIEGVQIKLDPRWIEQTITNFMALRPEGELPSKWEDRFNVNQYFKVLPHLSMEPGYVLDCDYNHSIYSTIYARPEDNSTHSSSRLANWVYSGYADYRVPARPYSTFNNYILFDGSPESYFEYILLSRLGCQIYMDPDSGIISLPVYDQKTLDDILKDGDRARDNRPYPGYVIYKAKFIVPDPVVIQYSDYVSVILTYYANNGGFIRVATHIRLKDHSIDIRIISTTIIEYEPWDY